MAHQFTLREFSEALTSSAFRPDLFELNGSVPIYLIFSGCPEPMVCISNKTVSAYVQGFADSKACCFDCVP